jgi:hypothetical protein
MGGEPAGRGVGSGLGEQALQGEPDELLAVLVEDSEQRRFLLGIVAGWDASRA